MKTFTDNAGRTWTVTINVDAVKRVRTLVQVNLLDVLDDGCKLLAELHDDPVLLVEGAVTPFDGIMRLLHSIVCLLVV